MSPLLLMLGLLIIKTVHGNSWSVNVLPVNNFGLISKNKMATIANYLKIIKICFENMSRLMSNGIFLLKRPYISLIIATRVWNVKATYRKSWPGNLFQLLTLTFDPFSRVKWGHITTNTLYLP